MIRVSVFHRESGRELFSIGIYDPEKEKELSAYFVEDGSCDTEVNLSTEIGCLVAETDTILCHK